MRNNKKGRWFDGEIFVAPFGEKWRLMVRSIMGESPAGSRLLMAQPWPREIYTDSTLSKVQFTFETKPEANLAAQKLAAYLGVKSK